MPKTKFDPPKGMFDFEDTKKSAEVPEPSEEEAETPDEIELTSIGIIADHNQGWYKRYPKTAIIDKNNQPTINYFKWYLEVINYEELNLIKYDKLSEENKKLFDERAKKETITFKEDKSTVEEEVIPIKEIEEEVEKMKKQRVENEKKNIKIIIEATGLTEKEIKEKAEAKQKELKGLITIEGATYLIGKELGCDMPEPTSTKKTKEISKEKLKDDMFKFEKDKEKQPKQEITIVNNIVHTKEIVEGKIYNTIYDSYIACHICNKERWVSGQTGGCLVCDKVMTLDVYQKYLDSLAKNIPKEKSKPKPEVKKNEEKPIDAQIVEEKYEITTVQPQQSQQLINIEQKKLNIKNTVELLEFTIKSVLKPKDFFEDHITKSGCLKLAATFSVSIEVLSIEIEKEFDQNGDEIDIHAHAKAKAIRPDGSYVIASASKSKSEYYSEKKKTYGRYNLHNLRATAATRATNRAILNAVGFGMVSAEEIGKTKDKEENDMFNF